MRVFDRPSEDLGSGPAPRSRPFPLSIAGLVALLGLVPLLVLALSDDAATAGLIDWTLPLVRALVHLTSLAAIAVLCVGTLLPADGPEELSGEARRLGRRGSGLALAAVVVCAVFLVWTYFDVIGRSPLEGANFGDFGTFLNELASGRAVLAQTGFLLVSALLAGIARSPVTLRMALFLAVAGTTTLALGGHAASESGHGIAMFAMTAHIGAASLWVGGLAGLAWLAWSSDSLPHSMVAEFSRWALVCAVVVSASGVVSAVVRVPLAALPGSLYGAVLLLKILALAVLIGFGAMHRRRLMAADTFGRAAFLKLAAGELLVMGLAYGLAIALVGLEPTPLP